MIKLSKMFVKDKSKHLIPEDMFDEKLIEESPTLALEFVQKAILYMGSVVKDYLGVTLAYSREDQPQLVQEAYQNENILDIYNTKLHDYLIKVSQAGLDSVNSTKLSRDLDTIKDFERIGDHLTNITDFFVERYQENQQLSVNGRKELTHMFEIIDQMIDDTLYAFENQDIERAKEVIKLEDKIDELEEKYRYRHIERLKKGEIKHGIAENYVDILANLERIADHLMNVASSVIEPLYVPQDVLIPKPKEIDKDI